VSQFQQPGVGGDKFEAANHEGHLLLFFPTVFRADVPTTMGTSDCVDAKIVNLSTGQVLEDAKVWGKAMVPQLKGAVPDGMVLGWLGKGQAKGGNSAPWIIQPHTEADVAAAEAYLAANPRNQFGQPQGQPAPQQQAPAWGQQAPAPASPAPATGGWGNPPAQAPAQGGWGAPAAAAGPNPAAGAPAPTATSDQGQFAGQWGNTAPAPAAPPVQAPDPGLVQALLQKGVTLPPGTSHDDAVKIWNQVGAA
jgi:hypothetical protein